MNKEEKIKKIVKELLRLKTLYYNGEQEVNDDIFDELENELRELDPENEYFNKIGYEIEVDYNNKYLVHHVVPMLSMDKVKTPDQAIRWASSLYLNNEINAITKIDNENWLVQPKIDGNSCTIKYDKDGRFMYMATRGDGNKGFIIKYGEDIMENNNIPLILYQSNDEDFNLYYGSEIELRGELYINQRDTLINPPLRNACAGIIKRIERTKELSSIKICLYNVINTTYKIYISYGDKFPNSIPIEKTIIPYSITTKIKDIDKIYNKYLESVRLTFPFETDGLVIYYPNKDKYAFLDSLYKDTHHHHYNIALKPLSKGSETYIKNIVYNVSKYGTLIPKAVVDPIKIDNVIISSVTLNNFDQIQKKNIKIGSKVEIIRSNDVIPMIKEVIGEFPNATPIHPLNTCISCGGKVIYSLEDKNLVCLNPKCKGKLISQILFFLDKTNVKGLAEKSIEKILNSNYGIKINSLSDFFRIFIKKTNDMKYLLGINYDKIVDQLIKTLNYLSLKEMIAYCAFIPSVGMKTLEKEDIKDIEIWFNNIKNEEIINNYPAWKKKVKKWLEFDEPYNNLIDLYIFLTTDIKYIYNNMDKYNEYLGFKK